MRLFDIAISALIYDQFTDFNNSYISFMDKTGGRPDLLDPAHRRALLKWLNQWQCRQFSKAHHSLASRQILAWCKGFDT
ncbi:hypothetical protein MUP77_04495, partial [Candidatus Bathyarchaeota archaeon]|nr:hypothetical protein [Candidatus Bathyarchaeota archaeon]